jgi:hypothetical protein
MTVLKKYKHNSKIILSAMILAVSMFFLSQCKPHGEVTIYGIIDTVDNCGVPYSVYFYPDFDSGSGDLSFSWDFGDGTSSVERNPAHIYQKTGLFQVTVTITNRDKTERKSINLDLQQTSLPVISGFEYFSGSNQLWSPSKITFHNISQHATSYNWNFGDGNSAQGIKNPTHIYTSPGNYTVKLKVACNGAKDSTQQIITILSSPSYVTVENVNVWLPSNYSGADLFCVVSLGIFDEYTSQPHSQSDLPITFNVNHQLYWFTSFNSDVLRFEIRNASDHGNLVYSFDTQMYKLKDDYYPKLVRWDSGNDFAAEVDFRYGL